MPTIKPRTASGFPEYLPEEQIEFNRLMSIIRETYEKYGFSPIDTPDLELREVLLAKGGGETEQQVYEFTRGRNDFVLPFDLTVPLARYTAQHKNELIFPFRRYHIKKVHRAERAQAGRFREFYQCDIDVIGTNSSTVDAEFPAIINEIFETFNFGEFTIRLNDRRILNGFFKSIGLSGHETDVMRLVDKIEKLSKEDFRTELSNVGLDADQADKLIAFTSTKGSNDAILAQLFEAEIDNEEYLDGVNNIKAIVEAIRAFGVPEKRFCIDLKIARGLDYYTGTVYETTLDDYPEIGSVCSGGRFDNLASHYTDTELPGVGVSIGLSRLFYKLREIGIIKPSAKSPATVVIIPMSETEYAYAASISASLRKIGVSNIIYTEKNAMKKKMRYADQMGFRWVVILDERERTHRNLWVKDMESGRAAAIADSELDRFDWNA